MTELKDEFGGNSGAVRLSARFADSYRHPPCWRGNTVSTLHDFKVIMSQSAGPRRRLAVCLYRRILVRDAKPDVTAGRALSEEKSRDAFDYGIHIIRLYKTCIRQFPHARDVMARRGNNSYIWMICSDELSKIDSIHWSRHTQNR
jgi:hypothetical protein